MKVFVITGILAIVAFSSAVPQPEKLTVKNLVQLNTIDTLVKNALEYIRTLFKKYEPFSVPDPPTQQVSGSDVELTVNFSNLKVSKASNFEIDEVSNNLLSLSAEFGVTVPSMSVEGEYAVDGVFQEKNVQGNGTFNLDVTNLVTSGYVKMKIVSYYLQMKTLNINYEIESLNFSADGLSVDGMTSDELQSVFSSSFLSYFQENEEFVASQVADYVKESANDIMYGKSLVALLSWLRSFASGSVIS